MQVFQNFDEVFDKSRYFKNHIFLKTGFNVSHLNSAISKRCQLVVFNCHKLENNQNINISFYMAFYRIFV